MEKKSLYASLIGINAYKQNTLNGCIRDVLGIDLLLRELCSQQGKDKLVYEPCYFLAPHKTDVNVIREYKKTQGLKFTVIAPTFKNVTTKAFEHFKNAKAGDICLLYYSGHGSQADAPEEFWHLSSGQLNETLVLQDSRDRDNADARDLVDKEIAWLLYDALKGKDVHCVVIMDCCHSGNNTREIADCIKYRDLLPSKTKIPFDKYLGKESGFYEVKEGKASIKYARHVHLAATMGSERALENSDGGIFTSRLIEVLRSGGTAKSYRELIRTVATLVRLRNSKQNPVPYALEPDDLDLQFLGHKLVPYTPGFDVVYYNQQGNPHWRLYGGTIHGLVPSSGESKTIVRIQDSDAQAEVLEVFPFYSILDGKGTADLQPGTNYKAGVAQLGRKNLQIAIGKALSAEPKMLAELKKEYKKGPYIYFSIDFKQVEGDADYYIELAESAVGSRYKLVKPGNPLPVFEREEKAADFLVNLEIVGKWTHVCAMKNANSAFKSTHFEFNAEKLEGVRIEEIDDPDKPWQKKQLQPDQEIVCNYVNGKRPALKFSVALTAAAPYTSCYIAALYMDAVFGISDNYIREDDGQLMKNKGAIHLKMHDEDTFFEVIPLELDPRWKLYNVSEATDLIKIFVSTKPFNLDVYKQIRLDLDGNPFDQDARENVRGVSSRTRTGDGAAEKDDWAVFTFRIRIAGSDKKKELLPDQKVEFRSFTIEVPEGFHAMASAVTGDDQKAKAGSTKLRGLDDDPGSNPVALVPPPGIWGEAAATSPVFEAAPETASDNTITAIELFPSEGRELVLPAGKPLIISPKASPVTTRSVDSASEETIVPYGYDEDLQLFFPVGFTDNSGNIHIDFLPPATSGNFLLSEEEQERSLGGSVKLFFKKLIRRKSVNRLVLHRFSQENGWYEVTDEPAKMQAVLAGKPDSKALLLVHGIIGDTSFMLECMKEIADKSSFLLTFDYENLSADISDIASSLHELLSGAGLFEKDMPELVIIAHSMGGLVARWLVEQNKPARNISRLLMIGTPSGGSEAAKLVQSVFGLLTHALNTTGILKAAIAGLGFLLRRLKADPGNTLKELQTGSKTIEQLRKSMPNSSTIYKVIGGDTALLEKGYAGSDFFLKRLSYVMKNKLVYPGLTYTVFGNEANDMAVTIKSMQDITDFDAGKHSFIAASNHSGYFADKECRQYIVDYVYN